MKPHHALAASLAVFATGLAPRVARAQPHTGTAAPAPDVARFDALLRSVVRADGVDYALLRTRLAELRAFHDALAHDGPTATPARYPTDAARKAYWLDAYNATVLRGIAEAPATMRNVLQYLPSNGFFHTRTWAIDGRQLTLDAIENHEVRERFHDPRVHTALNCGARSCPPLRAGAYDAAHVEHQLDEQATRYLNGAGHVAVDAATHTVRLVQLFDWFAADFALPVPGHAPTAVAGPLGFVYAFAAPPLRAQLVAACGADGHGCTVQTLPYDWTLNDAH